MNRSIRLPRSGPISFAFALLWSAASAAQGVPATQEAERHYDARLDYNSSFTALRSSAIQAPVQIQGLVADIQDLTVESNETTGAVATLANQGGYLTTAARGSPRAIALEFVRNNVAALGLEPSDLQGYAVSDVVYSKVTGATHIYLQQQYRGIPVYNGQLHVNVNRDGRIISVNNAFMPGLARAARALQPRIQLPDAVGAAGQFAGKPLAVQPKTLQSASGPQQATRVEHQGISLAPINGRLMLLPI
ncbi:MAG: hypothetical protein ACREUC_22425, partial [Steroidobacteraceae bacterium]